MDLSNPSRAVLANVQAAVLGVLTRTDRPLSGRAVAALLDDQVGYRRVGQVLAELTAAGVVLREAQPPANLYQLNRDHIAAAAIEDLTDLRARLMVRITQTVGSWSVRSAAVWLFGSAARGDGDLGSNIDLLVLRTDVVDEDDMTWREQLDHLAERVSAWTGNDCQILEYSETEIASLVMSGERLVTELRTDALPLDGKSPHAVLRARRASSSHI